MALLQSAILSNGLIIEGLGYNPKAYVVGDGLLGYITQSNVFKNITPPDFTSYFWYDIEFDGATGYCVSSNGTVIKSVDRGLNWFLMSNTLIDDVRCLALSPQGHIYIGGKNSTTENNKIIRSTDGALTFSLVFTAATLQPIEDIDFDGPNNIYAPTLQNMFFSQNQALTWSSSAITNSQSIDGIFVSDSQTIALNDQLGVSGLVYTTSAFTSFQYNVLPASASTQRAVWMINNKTAFLSSASGHVTKFTGKTTMASCLNLTNDSNITLQDIQFNTAATYGLTVGTSGSCYYTTNSGDSWTQIPAGSQEIFAIEIFN